MEWAVWLADRSLFLFVLVLFCIQYGARELGLFFASRRVARKGARTEEVSVLVGGMLGLLAFVLALTLSFATARFQERRDATLAEANAISTAWARADAIGHPRGEAIASLMPDYVRLRIDYITAPPDATVLKALNDRSSALQNRIWKEVTGLVRERSDAVASSVMAALGYQVGLRGQKLRGLSVLLIGMWTVVIMDIVDLSSPRVGNIRGATNAYEWVLEGFGAADPSR